MFDKPETYEELIRKKRCVELTKHYNITKEDLETIYNFFWLVSDISGIFISPKLLKIMSEIHSTVILYIIWIEISIIIFKLLYFLYFFHHILLLRGQYI